jgi:hypothetical protein
MPLHQSAVFCRKDKANIYFRIPDKNQAVYMPVSAFGVLRPSYKSTICGNTTGKTVGKVADFITLIL